MKKNSRLSRIFEEDEFEKFNKALRTQSRVRKGLIKILEDMEADLAKPTSLDEVGAHWPLKRAYQDGGLFYVQQLLTLFKE